MELTGSLSWSPPLHPAKKPRCQSKMDSVAIRSLVVEFVPFLFSLRELEVLRISEVELFLVVWRRWYLRIGQPGNRPQGHQPASRRNRTGSLSHTGHPMARKPRLPPSSSTWT